MKENLVKKKVLINSQSFLDKIKEKHPKGVEVEIEYGEIDEMIHVSLQFRLSELDYDIAEEIPYKEGEDIYSGTFRRFENIHCNDDDYEGKLDYDVVWKRHLFNQKKCKCNQ